MRRKLQVHHQQETHAWSAEVHKDTCGVGVPKRQGLVPPNH